MTSKKSESLKTYCIIGDPVDHSLSPAMQNAAFRALKLNCVYIAFRVAERELEAGIQSLRSTGIAGFNVTMPHKVAVMEFLDEFDPACSRISAVNTVNSEDERLKGYNTDIDGFIGPLKRRNIGLAGKVALIMGAGGAARAVLAALADADIERTIIAARNLSRAGNVAEEACKQGLDCEVVSFDEIARHTGRADLIVNATPMGMKQEPSPIKPQDIRKESIVYDLVYRPMETGLLRSAKEAGAAVVYGYEMLVEQGARSFEIWKKIEAPRDVMRKTLLGEFVQQP